MSHKPLLRVLAGEALAVPPVWLMRQAGRHLPEYKATRAQAGSFMDLCLDPELAAEVTVQPVRRYGMDAAILFSDILIVPWAMGQGLTFAEGEGPRLPPIRDRAGLDALEVAAVAERAAPIMGTVRRTRTLLAQHHPGVALIGFAGAPWTVGCYMIEGRGGGEFHQARRMMHGDPALFGAILARLEEATIAYLLAQAEAGAEALMLFDSWAGQLPPAAFRDFVIAPAARIRAAVRARFPQLPMIGFPRLAGPALVPYAKAAGMQAVAMDTAMDPEWANAHVPPGIALQGNLDPEALVAGGPALETGARRVVAALRGRPHVFNLGHGVEKETPIPHVEQLLRTVRGG